MKSNRKCLICCLSLFDDIRCAHSLPILVVVVVAAVAIIVMWNLPHFKSFSLALFFSLSSPCFAFSSTTNCSSSILYYNSNNNKRNLKDELPSSKTHVCTHCHRVERNRFFLYFNMVENGYRWTRQRCYRTRNRFTQTMC